MNRMAVKTSRTTSGIDWRMPKTCFVYQTPVTSGSGPPPQAGSHGGTQNVSSGSHGGGSGSRDDAEKLPDGHHLHAEARVCRVQPGRAGGDVDYRWPVAGTKGDLGSAVAGGERILRVQGGTGGISGDLEMDARVRHRPDF